MVLKGVGYLDSRELRQIRCRCWRRLSDQGGVLFGVYVVATLSSESIVEVIDFFFCMTYYLTKYCMKRGARDLAR